jgi:hypothetical protein
MTQSNQELIEKLKACVDFSHNIAPSDYGDEHFEALKELARRVVWQLVDENTPQAEDVLVCKNNGLGEITIASTPDGVRWLKNLYEIIPPTHWMPLPFAPPNHECVGSHGVSSAELFKALGSKDPEKDERGLNAVIRRMDMKVVDAPPNPDAKKEE